MCSLVTRRLYAQAIKKKMVYSHRERRGNATDTKQWLQKECSIKGNRIKSNKNPKAANNKRAACFKSIYNSYFDPKMHLKENLFFPFCFTFVWHVYQFPKVIPVSETESRKKTRWDF